MSSGLQNPLLYDVLITRTIDSLTFRFKFFNVLPSNVLQADPVFQETYKLRGDTETQKRQVLNLTKVEHTIQGLQQLIVSDVQCARSHI